LAVGSITLGLAMIAPGSATLAASSDHVNEHNVDVGCGALSGPGADAYLQLSFNSTFGSDARLQLWLHPDDIIVEQPTIVSGRADFVLGDGDSSLTGTFDLVDATQGGVVGIGTLDAQLTTSATFAMDDASCHASDCSPRLIARP